MSNTHTLWNCSLITILLGYSGSCLLYFMFICRENPTEESVCNAVNIGQEVRFEAKISLKACKSSGVRRFVIKPQDLADSLEVEVDVDCSCSCDDKVM